MTVICMKRILLALAVGALSVSCSTMKVSTNVLKQYPVSVGPQDVKVYENGDPVPVEAEVLGELTVYDDGFAKREPYDTTLFRAKRAVSEVGGNGLYIMEHIQPSAMTGTNHQLYGKMLFSPEGAVAVADNPLNDAFNSYAAQRQAVDDMIVKGHNIYATAGYGHLISEYDTGDVAITGGDISNGLEAEIGYEYVLKGGLGVGVLGSMFASSAQVRPEPMYPGTLSLGIKSLLATISFVESSDKLIFAGYFGFGYMIATNRLHYNTADISMSYDDKGPGLALALDLSYRFTNKTSLGVRAGTKKFTYTIPGDSTVYGYQTVNLGLIFRQAF